MNTEVGCFAHHFTQSNQDFCPYKTEALIWCLENRKTALCFNEIQYSSTEISTVLKMFGFWVMLRWTLTCWLNTLVCFEDLLYGTVLFHCIVLTCILKGEGTILEIPLNIMQPTTPTQTTAWRWIRIGPKFSDTALTIFKMIHKCLIYRSLICTSTVQCISIWPIS